MKRLVVLCCLCLGLMSFCLAGMTQGSDAFVSLFNGEDLDGWVAEGVPYAFRVKNESIYTTGAGPYPSWLRSEKQYENFIMRFDYKTEGWYEGGVVFHAPKDGPISNMGLKLHLRHDQKAFGVRSTGALYNVMAPRSVANNPSGQWNHCEIECDWPFLRVTLNDQVVQEVNMDSYETLRYRLRQGYVGIQNIGCRASFKNIEIRELPSKEKWTNLFEDELNGFDLHEEAVWDFTDGVLTGEGKNGFAFTKASFDGSYELQVWVKTIANGNGGININCTPEKRGPEVQVFNVQDSTNPTGSFYNIAPAMQVVSHDDEWFLMQVFCDGPHGMVLVNGTKVTETDSLPEPYGGIIGFQQHTPGAIIYYRGAKIRKVNWR